MQDEVIKRALSAASMAGCKAVDCCTFDGACEDAQVCLCHRSSEYDAAAIIAFLRHFGSSKGEYLHSFTVPDAWGMPTEIRIVCQQLDSLAAAIKRASGGGE